MKAAISIPDPTFEAAETLAARLGMSRSELYGKAVNDYIKSHKYHGATKKLDEVYGVDNEIHSMQIRSLS